MKYKYKFSYGNVFKYLLDQYIIMSMNFFISLCFVFVDYHLYNLLAEKFSKQATPLLIIQIMCFVLTSLFFAYMVVIFVIPKRVILTDSSIYIRKYFWDLANFSRGFNDKILLNDVIECKKYDGKRPRWDRARPYAVHFFEWDDLVEIVLAGESVLGLKDDKVYLVPIQNSEDFIKRVNERIKSNCL